MSKRRNYKNQNKLVKWFSPLHRWLYPAMTATLGIMAEDEDAILTNLLKDFEVDELTPN